MDTFSVKNTEKQDIETPKFLAMQGHVVSGYVGNKCAVFALQALGFEVDSVNAVQASNHCHYPKWGGHAVTGAELDDLIKCLRENDLLEYTHILTGFIRSESFLIRAKQLILELKKQNPNIIYLCDPVLGDNGSFYVNVHESLLEIYQNEMLPLADITTPNTFELEVLSGMKIKTEKDALMGMQIIHKKGVRIVVLSSLDSDGQEISSYVSFLQKSNDLSSRSVWKVICLRYEGHFDGTGDLFAALFLGWYQKLGGDVPGALQTTLASMETILDATQKKRLKRDSKFPHKKGKPFELQLIQSREAIVSPTISKLSQSVFININIE